MVMRTLRSSGEPLRPACPVCWVFAGAIAFFGGIVGRVVVFPGALFFPGRAAISAQVAALPWVPCGAIVLAGFAGRLAARVSRWFLVSGTVRLPSEMSLMKLLQTSCA